uniref:PH domain-containing protein n=1 Tax=Cyprinus carpio TaxID=7962 RepID=A0A8C2FJ97_CYPCA
MSNNKKKPTTSIFYNEPVMVEELYTGYLVKSPPLTAVTKNTLSQKSWKRRFFELSKTGEDYYQLTYYANNERRDKPSGEIDLSRYGKDCQSHNSRVHIYTQKSRNTLQDSKIRSATEPIKSLEPKVEDEPGDRRSAPELMLTYPSPYSHYDYPRKLSEPPLPVALKIPVIEDEDDEDEMQDESAEDSEYMSMASFETHTHVEKEICISQNDLKNSLILTQEGGKPCVSDCRKIQDSCLFHKGDQILAFNDLLIDTVEEIQTYVRRLSKDEVKLTIRRLIGSQPLHSEPCAS